MPYPYQIYSQYQAPQYQTQSGLIWVQGEAGAKSYLVAPGNTVALWDSESKTIYIKSADAAGMPSMKTIDYTFRGGEDPAQNVTKADLKTLQDQIDELRKELHDE